MGSHGDLGADTLIQHLGEEVHHLGAIAPPVFQASNFLFPSVEAYHSAQTSFTGDPPYVYSRVSNPTVDLAEHKIAALEGTERCRVTGSGMSAITLALMSLLTKDSHVVAVDTCYGPVKSLLDEYLPRFGISVTYVDGLCVEDMIDAIRPETKALYLESPSTFVFRLQDLRAISAAAKEKGVATFIDNTYATPLFQNPAELGIDYVLHSASKYLGGHSDIVAGAICATEARMRPILQYEINLVGSALAPFSAWLLIRGLRTLPVRLRRHQESGNAVAAFLEDHPDVDRVHHVGLPSFPQKALRDSQMKGAGGLLSFEPKRQELEYVKRFTNALKLFGLGVSWGGFESLVVPVETQPLGYPEKRWVIRLFTGLEDVNDLVTDLKRAFEVAKG